MHCRITDHREAGEEEQQLFADGTRPLWDRCTLAADFAAGTDAAGALAAAALQMSVFIADRGGHLITVGTFCRLLSCSRLTLQSSLLPQSQPDGAA